MAYYLGILTFGQIFVAFESAVQGYSADQKTSETHDEPQRNPRLLSTLHTAGLQRTQNLKQDLGYLSRHLKAQDAYISEVLSKTEERLRNEVSSKTRAVEDHIQHRPYLALAYAWSMYLALFNGGRYLHRSLAAAGPQFWFNDQDVADAGITALSFWHFDAASESDPGADQLKIQFKANFDAAASMLTKAEEEEVVEEAQGLFKLCMDLVCYLDGVTAAYQEEINHPSTGPQNHPARPSPMPTRRAQQAPARAWKIWDAVQSASAGFVHGLAGNLWQRPFTEKVKE